MSLLRTTRLVSVSALAMSCAAVCWAAVTPDDCHVLRKHGHETEAIKCYESLGRSTSAYLRAEGYWGLQQYDQANEQFRIAIAQPDATAMYRVRWAMLLHERFNNADAVGLFKEALQQDPNSAQAFYGLALVSADGFDGKAKAEVAQAIKLDPKYVAAHELMASLALEDDDTKMATAEADEALKLDPDAMDAMAIHAAIELNADHPPDAWLAKIHAVNAGYGEADSIIAHDLELHYRYEDAIDYYRKAIAADPKLWSAHSELGINLMRMGKEEEPLKELELSYNNGYRDAATVNSLRLLDSYKNFVTFKDDTTILRFRKKEAELLHPYYSAELHKILTTYDAKYKMKLPGPVQVEVYPDHEDFAVRTMGMPGLGALGVTFGEVIAMDSPSGRRPGDFNWGSTLWHEMSHVYILTATNHRVPRWFTEGLAVHEEGQAAPEWSNRVTPEVLAAIRDKKLLPLAQLDRGFVSPEYPGQVIVSYFQAGSICDYISSKWGEAKLLDMVHAYALVKPTPEVVQQVLGVSTEEFDKQYLQWLDKAYGKEAANFDEWRKSLKALAGMAEAKQYDVVITMAPAVRDGYPEYVGEANAYEFLAEAYAAKSDKKNAAAVLTAYAKMGGEDPAMLKELALLQVDAGQTKEAAATLDRINYIYPMDEALHRKLGELWFAQANYAGAIREYGAVVALNPLDKAGAQYDLARAYFAAGQREQAEASVLLALEAAPGYRPAQKLLLEMQDPDKKSSDNSKQGREPADVQSH